MAQCTTTRNGTVYHKKQYQSKPEARTAMVEFARAKKLPVKMFKPYHCDECGEFHYGRRPGHKGS